MTIAGRRMYVYCALGGICGVSAEPADAGKLLWRAAWSARVVAPSPVQLDGGRIFQAAGYGKGGMTVEVVEKGGAFEAAIIEEHDPKSGIACEQQTAVYYDGLLYAIMPKDAGGLHGEFVCYTPEGALVWSSGSENRFGLGPFLLADKKFYVLNDNGTLTMLRASREKFEALSQARVLDGQDAWGPIALAGTRMLLRDSRQMVCIDVGANQEKPL
jgi:outer membrane protein assembly factor BamB